jgi:hypothetical protein
MKARRYDHRDCAAFVVVLVETREGYGEVKASKRLQKQHPSRLPTFNTTQPYNEHKNVCLN